METTTRKPRTVTAPRETEAEWKTRQEKRDTAPYVPNGNRPFSIWADESRDRPPLVTAWRRIN